MLLCRCSIAATLRNRISCRRVNAMLAQCIGGTAFWEDVRITRDRGKAAFTERRAGDESEDLACRG